jgi:hypothetical protein
MTKHPKSVPFWLGVLAVFAVAGSAAAQTTKYDMRSGEVVAVTGNQLIVKVPEGMKELMVDPNFKFDLNGQPVGIGQLKPGMKLTALITTTVTPLDLQSTELRNAEVIYTNGASIVVKSAEDGKYRRFTNDQMKAMDLLVYKDGHVVSPTSLKKGDRISAVVVTKFPPLEMTDREIQILVQHGSTIPPNANPVRKVKDNDAAMQPRPPAPEPPDKPEKPEPPPPPPPPSSPK